MKKVLSLFLVTCLLLSCSATVFADGGHSTKVVYVGEGISEWELDVPIQLAPGESGDVILSGTWDSITIVNVTADETVTLSNNVDEATKTLGITFAGINQVGNMDNAIEVTKPIKVADMDGGIFGVWEGIFNYYVTLDSTESIEVVDMIPSGGVLPENCVYYSDMKEPDGDELSFLYDGFDDIDDKYNNIIYTGAVPESVMVGDIVKYNGYIYIYGYCCVPEVVCYKQDNWSVLYVGNSTEPPAVLKSINGKPITNMSFAFAHSDIVVAPEIPDTVRKMEGTFTYCENLVTAPIIPASVEDLGHTFDSCYNLTGVVIINSSTVTNDEGTFADVLGSIILKGDSPYLETFASQYDNISVE